MTSSPYAMAARRLKIVPRRLRQTIPTRTARHRHATAGLMNPTIPAWPSGYLLTHRAMPCSRVGKTLSQQLIIAFRNDLSGRRAAIAYGLEGPCGSCRRDPQS